MDTTNSEDAVTSIHPLPDRPQFNAKYMDDDHKQYLKTATVDTSCQPRHNSGGSTSSTSPNTTRNSSRYTPDTQQISIDNTLDTTQTNRERAQSRTWDSGDAHESITSRRGSMGTDSPLSTSMQSSKSYSGFMSLRRDRSSQSSKKSSKRSSLLNKILPLRRESESSNKSYEMLPPRSASVSAKTSHTLFSSPTSNSFQFAPKLPPAHGHVHRGSLNDHQLFNHDQHHFHIRGRLPPEKGLSYAQPLSQHHPSLLTPHHDHMMQRSSTIESNLDEDMMSIPMSATNTLAQSYGITLLDENDDDDMESIANSVGMSRVGSASSMLPLQTNSKTFWRPPESWKVRHENSETKLEPQKKNPNELEGTVKNENVSQSSVMNTFDSDVSSSLSRDESVTNLTKTARNDATNNVGSEPNAFTPSLSTLKQESVNKQITAKKNRNELRGSSRSSVRIFKGEKSSLLPCTLETSCKDILDVLRRKKFLKQDDDHMLVLKCGGLTRTLSLDEQPLKLQRKMLFLYGYTEKDNLDYIERTDMSFLFKFNVEEKGVELISEEKRRMINPQQVDLANWNLQDIPNFLYAEPIVTLDVSQNPSFEFTQDFMHDSRNLTTLSFTRSGSPVFPEAIVHAPRLVNLDLEVNYIKSIPADISNLISLHLLNLACNRINQLPNSFALLSNLQSLNLASNRLKTIPSQIFQLQQLKKLDLSYNTISQLPEKLSALKDLEVLTIAGNRLTGDLPDFFENFNQLIKVDMRFNNLTSIDSLKSSKKLEVVRATGNNISVFRSKAPNLFQVELNMNPLTYVYFECDMQNLKVIDFSKGKLTSCTFTAKLVAAEKLVLDYNHLSILPDDLDKMKSLQTFSIFKNNLTHLPDSLCKLKKLKVLDVHLNNIGKVNPNIWQLGSLEILNLASNLLESFPDPPDAVVNTFNGGSPLERFKNSSLTEDMDRNSSVFSEEAEDDVTGLPAKRRSMLKSRKMSEGGSLSITLGDRENLLGNSLKQLCLCDNKLTDIIFSTLTLFHNLECLNLSYNDIFEIPSGYLSNFSQLKNLYLSGNYLSSLPVEDLDGLVNLCTLHLNGNRFGTLPAELSKLHKLTNLDVGSNQLKYNIGNIPYDWNWCYNKDLQYLNFSGNKRLEIKPQQNHDEDGEKLDSFLGLKKLRMLGLMDVTITTDAVPDQSVGTRIRTTVSQLGKFGYGISDCLAASETLTTRDVVIERFRGNVDEFLITIYDGKNSVLEGGDKISKIIQETFEIHLAEELESLGKVTVPGNNAKTVEDCLRGAFLTMNSEMGILINRDELSTFSSAAAHRTKTTDKLTLEEDGLSGCSATIIYIRSNYIYVANVGDIMGILTKSDGEFNMITTKHEPYAPKEYDRIRDSGGYVTTDGYLDGVSDVSRAVGFFKLMPHINAKPSIHKFKLTQNEEMIAICTNEIWKRVSFELAADIIRQEKSNPLGAAEKLRDFAISYGSKGRKATSVVLSLRQFTTKQKHHNTSKPEDSILRKLDDEIEPPTGDLAMVFTDIKNSTLLWDNYPVAMRSAIKVHNAIMRRQLRIIGGYEVKTEGDAFIVSFPTPTAALLWCFIVQSQLLTTNEWPAEILANDQGLEIKDNEGNLIFRGLSVRMGIHWGTPVCEMDVVTKRMDYFGPMVNRASRVSSVADGGQITMSTDFYHEMEKVNKIHKMIKDGKVDVNRSYGYKTKGKDVENQMNQLENIGIVLENIGARKLKGLETPENIWLVFPKPLSSRLKMLTNKNGEIYNKSNKLIVGGITVEVAWALRKIALRLEKVASFFSTLESQSTINQYKTFTDNVKNEAETVMSEKLANIESFMLLFLDHTITRIENCVTVLGARQIIGEEQLFKKNTICLLDALKSMTAELEMLRAKVGTLEGNPNCQAADHHDKIVAVDN